MAVTSPLLEPRPKPKARVTAADVQAAMRDQYREPVWALLLDVPNATGARHTRIADAIAMGLWPSRGLDLHGFEIKVSRHDWLRERDRPDKAEPIAAYCDYWWLVAAPGVVERIEDIPANWGWMECDGNALTMLKPAMRLADPKPIDRLFLAALLRRAARTDEGALQRELDKRDQERRATFEEEVALRVERRLADSDRVLRDVEAFEKESGLTLSGYRGWGDDAAKLGRAVKAVMATGIDETYTGLWSLAQGLRDAAGKIDDGMRGMGLRPREPAVKPKRRRREKAEAS